MMQRTAEYFVKELEQFAIGVQSFSRLATEVRGELHRPPHQPQPSGHGMPRETASIPNVQVIKRRRRQIEIPNSIRHLCTSTVVRAQLDARTAETAFAWEPCWEIKERPLEPLLVKHIETGAVFEAVVATTPSIASEFILRRPQDDVKLWTAIFRPNSDYQVASSTESFERVVGHVRALSREQLKGILDTWLHSLLWQRLQPWDEQRATDLKALICYRYAVGELPVFLRGKHAPPRMGRPILRAR
ncbi:hypothetical protein [Paraburkholderia caffeinilytica]|uniref:hypothetical protein n=1 Tax=Paraburkholderia caffeinilytica TaxID=1761016 RepID=UPI0038BB0034